ncbi:GNAT family N-acetyltransferase [Carnobacteriaceae bacterium zg-C25]|nr:GNAT family N-acetyltransferase [Carnobacteriaceae bacterium zg-C25]
MIKPCTLQDVSALQHIASKTFVDTFGKDNTAEDMKKHVETAYHLDKLSRELQEDQSQYYFLMVDDGVAGYLKLNWGTAQSEEMGEQTLEIQCLYVDVAFKRQGYGKQMMDFAISKAKELGKTSVWLGVWERNTAAIAFYQSVGFEQNGAHSFWVGDDEQIDWIMEKKV